MPACAVIDMPENVSMPYNTLFSFAFDVTVKAAAFESLGLVHPLIVNLIVVPEAT